MRTSIRTNSKTVIFYLNINPRATVFGLPQRKRHKIRNSNPRPFRERTSLFLCWRKVCEQAEAWRPGQRSRLRIHARNMELLKNGFCPRKLITRWSRRGDFQMFPVFCESLGSRIEDGRRLDAELPTWAAPGRPVAKAINCVFTYWYNVKIYDGHIADWSRFWLKRHTGLRGPVANWDNSGSNVLPLCLPFPVLMLLWVSVTLCMRLSGFVPSHVCRPEFSAAQRLHHKLLIPNPFFFFLIRRKASKESSQVLSNASDEPLDRIATAQWGNELWIEATLGSLWYVRELPAHLVSVHERQSSRRQFSLSNVFVAHAERSKRESFMHIDSEGAIERGNGQLRKREKTGHYLRWPSWYWKLGFTAPYSWRLTVCPTKGESLREWKLKVKPRGCS